MSEAPEAPPPPRDRQFVQSLERGLSVIRALSAPEPQTLSDVARATGLTRAASRRFLLTLQQLGYVHLDGTRFQLTPQVLELGYAYLSSLTLPEVAQPHLERLVEEVHESSSVSVLDGGDVVYVARVPTRSIMRVAISVGTRFPAYATSMGRVLLAGLGAERLEDYFARAQFQALTQHTEVDPVRLRRAIADAGRAGYALVEDELAYGVIALAVPVHDSAQRVVASLNTSSHSKKTTRAVLLKSRLPMLLDVSNRISRELARVPGLALSTRT